MPQSGSDGKGYGLLKAFGHKKTRTFPGISALLCESPYLKHLNGTKVQGRITLYRNGKTIASKEGEILLAKDGISGPPVLDLARAVGERKGDYTVSFPMLNHLEQLTDYRNILEGRSYLPVAAKDFLDGILSNKWTHVVLKECGLKGEEPMDQLAWEEKPPLESALFLSLARYRCAGLRLRPGHLRRHSPFGFQRGSGVLHAPGLYAAGEVLDVDGDCGGYNIHWAVASAHRIARAIVKNEK